MRDKWQKLENWLAANAPRVLETLNPPADEARIAVIEDEFGWKFPPSVRESYLLHDGQPTHSWGLFGGNRFMSLDDVIAEVKMMIEIEKDCRFGDFDAALMIPVVDQNHSGDFYYVENSIDCRETELIEWWHEEPTRDVKAASFKTFFDDFLDRVEAGGFVFHVFEPHPFSDVSQGFGLVGKAELEQIQSERSSPVERKIVSSEIIEQSNGKMIYKVVYRETFRN